MSTNGETFFGESGEEKRDNGFLQNQRRYDGGEEAVGSNCRGTLRWLGQAAPVSTCEREAVRTGGATRRRMKRRIVARDYGVEVL